MATRGLVGGGRAPAGPGRGIRELARRLRHLISPLLDAGLRPVHRPHAVPNAERGRRDTARSGPGALTTGL
ncbi:hypothetical protein [Streptomyces hydrogenans]